MDTSLNAVDLLRSLRERQGRSLRVTAAELGVAPSQLSRLERGQRGLREGMPERLATYYGVSAELIELSLGEVPTDIVAILQAHPEELLRLRAKFSDAERKGGRIT